MKRLSVILGLLFFAQWGFAQRPNSDFSNRTTIGFRAGVNLPGMVYTDKHLSVLPQQTVFRPVGGIFVEIPLAQRLSIAPEVMYVERGMKTNYIHSSGYNVSYSIHSRYVDLRVPLNYYFHVTPWFQPYITAGMDAGYLLGGTIQLQQPGLPCPEATIMIGKANMRPWYIGAFGGLGMRFRFHINEQIAHIILNAIYNFDFLDSFTEMEHNDAAQPINVNAYNITGKRYPQGFEITVGMAFPIGPDKDDACYSFYRNKWK